MFCEAADKMEELGWVLYIPRLHASEELKRGVSR